MTKRGVVGGAGGEENSSRCAWCGSRFAPNAGPARPRRFCKRSCRQRDFESRRRAAEVGLSEAELVVARTELSRLDDMVYVLACAIEDVERDLAGEHDAADVQRSLEWLLEAARPLAAASVMERLASTR